MHYSCYHFELTKTHAKRVLRPFRSTLCGQSRKGWEVSAGKGGAWWGGPMGTRWPGGSGAGPPPLASPGPPSEHRPLLTSATGQVSFGAPEARVLAAALTHAFPDFLTPCSRACLELEATLWQGVAIPARKPN